MPHSNSTTYDGEGDLRHESMDSTAMEALHWLLVARAGRGETMIVNLHLSCSAEVPRCLWIICSQTKGICNAHIV